MGGKMDEKVVSLEKEIEIAESDSSFEKTFKETLIYKLTRYDKETSIDAFARAYTTYNSLLTEVKNLFAKENLQGFSIDEAKVENINFYELNSSLAISITLPNKKEIEKEIKIKTTKEMNKQEFELYKKLKQEFKELSQKLIEQKRKIEEEEKNKLFKQIIDKLQDLNVVIKRKKIENNEIFALLVDGSKFYVNKDSSIETIQKTLRELNSIDKEQIITKELNILQELEEKYDKLREENQKLKEIIRKLINEEELEEKLEEINENELTKEEIIYLQNVLNC